MANDADTDAEQDAEQVATETAEQAGQDAASGIASGQPPADAAQRAGIGAASSAAQSAASAAGVPGEVGQAAQAGSAVAQAAAAGGPAAAATAATSAGASAATSAAGGALAGAGAPPEVVSAATQAASRGLDGLASAVVEVVAGEQALPKANYHFTVTDDADAHWMVRRFQLDEALSEPYLAVLDLVTEDLAADTEGLLGAAVELTIDRESVLRTVCGIVHQVEFLGATTDRLRIRVEVVPAFALAEQRVDTRLWQDITVPDVVKEVLEAALADYEREVDVGGLTATYEARTYVVQYHESDLDFVSRLLEDEGISYWFDHERGEGKEVMVLEDSTDNYVDVQTIDDNPELHLVAEDRAAQMELETVNRFDWTRELTSTTVYQRIFDWLDPTVPSEANAPAAGDSGTDDRGLAREVYHHGRFVEPDPEPRTIRKLDHRKRRDQVASGHANVTGFFPGRKFTLVEHQRSDLDGEYLLRRVVHVGDCPEVVHGDRQQGPRYQCRFEAVKFDTDQPPRPAPNTRRPRIYGPQTAIVTGPDGEEIHTDEHGRVKVRFDWDREHELTDDTSMWIRVAHNWAGPGFGTFFVPRVGMEVLVEFLEGNPDQPLVVGCVYNGDNAISVGVPDNKTQSTIRTKSSPSSDGYNELRFEDAAGSEEIFLHAQKDLNETVENCHSTSVGADQSNSVGGNQTNSVDKDQNETVSGNQTMAVTGTRDKTITGDETNTLEGNRSTTVLKDELLEVIGTTTTRSTDTVTLECQKDYVQTVGGKSEVSVSSGPGGAGDGSITAANNFEITAASKVNITQDGAATITLEGSNATHTTAGTFTGSATGDMTLSSDANLVGSGASKIEINQGGAAVTIEGGKVSITSPSEITLTVGGSSVKVDPSGVTISGPKIDVTASGVTTIAGSVVKVN